MSGAGPFPAERIDAPPIVLRRHQASDAAPLIEAINASLEHLAPWMAWADRPATTASIGAFLAQSIREFEAGTDFNYLIVDLDAAGGSVLGGCGLHWRSHPGIEIGYWVHAGHTRRGIARAAASALCDAAFAMAIDRVEIHCDERNIASAAVARSAGFELVDVARRAARTARDSDAEMIWALDRPAG
ncbi:MAG: GNAT family N-acetyltransferase [Acidimicrobiales bacterium]